MHVPLTTRHNLVTNSPQPHHNFVTTSPQLCHNLVATSSQPRRNLVATSLQPHQLSNSTSPQVYKSNSNSNTFLLSVKCKKSQFFIQTSATIQTGFINSANVVTAVPACPFSPRQLSSTGWVSPNCATFPSQAASSRPESETLHSTSLSDTATDATYEKKKDQLIVSDSMYTYNVSDFY